MPSTGFYLFLLCGPNYRSKMTSLCQCPQRASTYFFITGMYNYGYDNIVSMPSTGFYLFLQDIDACTDRNDMCQCPQRASTYFFEAIPNYWTNRHAVSMPSTGFYLFLLKLLTSVTIPKLCVNALNGLLLISSVAWTQVTIPCTYLCQCPQRASTYFFDDKTKTMTIKTNVSMPSTGFYLFLLGNMGFERPIYAGVNALNGLLLISSIRLRTGKHLLPGVSMPSTGFYLFLQIITGVKKLMS